MLAVTAGSGPQAVEVPVPECQQGEVTIRVERVGICSTDLAMFKNYADFRDIIGHEFAGTVVGYKSSPEFPHQPDLTGKRVTASINIPGQSYDKFDWQVAKHDPSREAIGIRDRDGAMAEYISLPSYLIHILPENVSFEEGAMAEPLAAAIHAVDSLQHDENTVLLIGDGRLAQLIAKVLVYRKIKTVAIGKVQSKLGILESAGIEVYDNPSNLAGRKFQGIIEASGSESGVNTAINLAKPGAKVILKSTLPGRQSLDLSDAVVNELQLIGSRCGNITDALEMISSGKIKVSDLISKVYPLAKAEEAFNYAVLPDTIKVQLSPHGN